MTNTVKLRQNDVVKYKTFIYLQPSKDETKPENLDEGDETYSQAETKEAAYVADQTDSEHLLFVNLKMAFIEILTAGTSPPA